MDVGWLPCDLILSANSERSSAVLANEANEQIEGVIGFKVRDFCKKTKKYFSNI